MKLFQRKQQSSPIIPPELQPYYGSSSSYSRSLDRGRIIALVIILLVIAAVTGLIMWYGSHRNQNTTRPAQLQSTQAPQKNAPLDKNNGTPATTPSSSATNSAPIAPPTQ